MRRSILLSAILVKCLAGFSQTNNVEANELSFAVPILYNKTTITNVFGPTRQISGTGVSSGISVQYKRILSNGIYAKLGLGYFAQNFSLRRPYEDFDFTALLYTTRKYTYHCWEQTIGVGYSISTSKKSVLDISANYHRLNTFKQKYYSRDDLNITETRSKYHFSSMVSVVPSIQRKISDKIKISTGIIIPILTSWKKDLRFDENRNDTYSPSLHIGIQLGVHYNF